MAFLIRVATDADAPALAAIYRPYVEDSRVSFEEVAPDAAEMARRLASGPPGLYPWLLAEGEDGALGYASSSAFRARPAYRWTVETGIYLAADAHGRGLGRTLLSNLIDLLQRQGFVAAIGAIALPNDASVALHEKLGFYHTGTYRQVGRKLGAWLDVGLWQRDLAPRSDTPAEPRPYAGLISPV